MRGRRWRPHRPRRDEAALQAIGGEIGPSTVARVRELSAATGKRIGAAGLVVAAPGVLDCRDAGAACASGSAPRDWPDTRKIATESRRGAGSCGGSAGERSGRDGALQMATVIDELVLRLGLDASQFTRGQEEFQRNLRKVQDETGTRGKEIEAAGNKMADAFRRVRNEVFALAASVFAIRGLREFAQEIIQNEAAIGRWAKVIGMSTEDLSAWGGAAERAGGTMGATTGTLNGLMQQFQQFALTGQSQVVPYFRALGVQITDTEGKMRPMGDILLDLADKFHAMSPERAESFGTALGLDQGTINLLIQGRQAVEQLLEAQRRLGVVHKEDAEAGQALINNLLDLQQAVRDVGRAIITDLAPDIEHMLEGMRDWIVQNKEWVKTEIAEKIRAFSTYLQSIDWKAVGQGIHDFFSGINNVVTALGGWERVSEAIFALWVGSKFTGVIAAIALLGTRLLPITIAIAAIMAGWAAINAASENLNNPSGWSTQSPFWGGMSEEDQLKFTNSPASQKRAGTGGRSLAGRVLDWATGGAPPAEGTPAGDVAKEVHDFWREQGLTEEQTAGDHGGGVGPESGFNPNAVNPTSGVVRALPVSGAASDGSSCTIRAEPDRRATERICARGDGTWRDGG